MSQELKAPPHSIQAEASTLGSMILGGVETVADVRALVKAESFYRPAHQIVFRGLLALADGNKAIDLVLLRDELTRRTQLAAVGGVVYLVALAESVPSPANAAYYAGIVRDKALLRALLQTAREIAASAMEPGAEGMAQIRAAEQAVYRLVPQNALQTHSSLTESVEAVLERAQRVQSGKEPPGLSVGWETLDRATGGGLKPENLCVVAGATSVGKSSLALQFAANVGAAGGSVALFSYEMSRAELAQRVLSRWSGVNGLRISDARYLQGGEWERLETAAAETADWGAGLILYAGGHHVAEIAGAVRRQEHKAGKQVALVVVDYLQRMPLERGDSHRNRIDNTVTGLKNLARDMGLPVMLVSQLSREHQRRGEQPSLADLKESSAIEQEADVVILLHRPNKPTVGTQEELEIRIAKGRMGAMTAWTPVWFDRPTTSFSLDSNGPARDRTGACE